MLAGTVHQRDGERAVDCNGGAPHALNSFPHNTLDLSGVLHATSEHDIFRILAANFSTANPTANQPLRSVSPPARLWSGVGTVSGIEANAELLAS